MQIIHTFNAHANIHKIFPKSVCTVILPVTENLFSF